MKYVELPGSRPIMIWVDVPSAMKNHYTLTCPADPKSAFWLHVEVQALPVYHSSHNLDQPKVSSPLTFLAGPDTSIDPGP